MAEITSVASAADSSVSQVPLGVQAANESAVSDSVSTLVSGQSEKPKRKPTLEDLPLYTRSLLRINVPVVVTLAEKRQSLGQIMELVPGSLIQFEKSCEEMLELTASNHPIATGEAVKVGDKFGLRITSVTLPEERFDVVRS